MCSQDYVMIGAVRAHVDDKKRAKYGVPPPAATVQAKPRRGRCMTVKHSGGGHCGQTVRHTQRAAPQSVDVLSSPRFSGL